MTAFVGAVALTGVALFAAGATVGVLTGGPLLYRGARQLSIGAGAAIVTYGLGSVLGVAATSRYRLWPASHACVRFA